MRRMLRVRRMRWMLRLSAATALSVFAGLPGIACFLVRHIGTLPFLSFEHIYCAILRCLTMHHAAKSTSSIGSIGPHSALSM